MPGIIVLDGCEKAGKTTLANRISDVAKEAGLICNIWKGSGDEPFTQRTFEWLGQNRCDLVILDRAWPSKWVYGDQMGFAQKPGALGDGAERQIRRWIESRGVCRILIQHPSILETRRTEDDLGTAEQEFDLWLQYAETWNWEVLELREGHNNVLYAAMRLIGEAMDRAADVKLQVELMADCMNGVVGNAG
jgi:hypothetical protein